MGLCIRTQATKFYAFKTSQIFKGVHGAFAPLENCLPLNDEDIHSLEVGLINMSKII